MGNIKEKLKKRIRARRVNALRNVSSVSSEEELLGVYKSYTSRKVLFIVACILAMLVVMGLAITIGSYPISFVESYEVIWDHITGNIADETKDHVVINLRLPRIIVGVLAGAGLAVSGAVMQGIMKNPLADPYTTGISSGASLGATLAMISGLTVLGGNYSLVGNAFLFSLIPAAVIVVVAKLKGSSAVTMILSGLAVMYFFNSITTFMMLRADPDDLAAVYAWQVGSLTASSWEDIPIMFSIVVAGSVVVAFLSSKINILASGDENATTLGIDAGKLRIVCLITVSLMSASVVSYTGIIGFVGLVCPHIVRLFIGGDNRYLLPASLMFGAAFLMICDLIARSALPTGAVPVGVVTSFIGGPMFLYLILKNKSGARRWG